MSTDNSDFYKQLNSTLSKRTKNPESVKNNKEAKISTNISEPFNELKTNIKNKIKILKTIIELFESDETLQNFFNQKNMVKNRTRDLLSSAKVKMKNLPFGKLGSYKTVKAFLEQCSIELNKVKLIESEQNKKIFVEKVMEATFNAFCQWKKLFEVVKANATNIMIYKFFGANMKNQNKSSALSTSFQLFIHFSNNMKTTFKEIKKINKDVKLDAVCIEKYEVVLNLLDSFQDIFNKYPAVLMICDRNETDERIVKFDHKNRSDPDKGLVMSVQVHCKNDEEVKATDFHQYFDEIEKKNIENFDDYLQLLYLEKMVSITKKVETPKCIFESVENYLNKEHEYVKNLSEEAKKILEIDNKMGTLRRWFNVHSHWLHAIGDFYAKVCSNQYKDSELINVLELWTNLAQLKNCEVDMKGVGTDCEKIKKFMEHIKFSLKEIMEINDAFGENDTKVNSNVVATIQKIINQIKSNLIWKEKKIVDWTT